jgi:hypothetical protein
VHLIHLDPIRERPMINIIGGLQVHTEGSSGIVICEICYSKKQCARRWILFMLYRSQMLFTDGIVALNLIHTFMNQRLKPV